MPGRGGQGGGGIGRGAAGGAGRRRGGGQGMGRARMGGRGPGAGGACVCPACGATAPHRQGVPCAQLKCTACGAAMTRGE